MEEYGTDFVIIGKILGKSRDQVKRKFKVMEKKVNGFGFGSEIKSMKNKMWKSGGRVWWCDL